MLQLRSFSQTSRILVSVKAGSAEEIDSPREFRATEKWKWRKNASSSEGQIVESEERAQSRNKDNGFKIDRNKDSEKSRKTYLAPKYKSMTPPSWLPPEGRNGNPAIRTGYTETQQTGNNDIDEEWGRTLDKPVGHAQKKVASSESSILGAAGEKTKLPWERQVDNGTTLFPEQSTGSLQSKFPHANALPWLNFDEEKPRNVTESDEIAFRDRELPSTSSAASRTADTGRPTNWRQRFKLPESNSDPKLSSQASRTPYPFPWNVPKPEQPLISAAEREAAKKEKPPTLAELTLDPEELKRLRALAVQQSRGTRVKIGRAGVTQGVADFCHNAWKSLEIVRIRCEGAPAYNMKKTCEELESMTGGMVIWRSGGSAALYRGADYVPPTFRPAPALAPERTAEDQAEMPHSSSPCVSPESLTETELAEAVAQDPTFGLGPKFEGWKGSGFIPVDADILVDNFDPAQYQKPFRVLPYGVKHSLGNTELTEQRKEARRLQPHFILSRNRELHGLAAAIVKLWDRVEVVKVQVKKGVMNTSNERMAQEIKALTGGILLSRDKFFIVFHRGKDFLPSAIADTLRERHFQAVMSSDKEERDRLLGFAREPAQKQADGPFSRQNAPAATSSETNPLQAEIPAPSPPPAPIGSLEESLLLQQAWASRDSSQDIDEARQEAVRQRKREEARAVEAKLAKALLKMERAALEVAKLDLVLQPAELPKDVESITEEERYMFRRLGSKMKQYLELGKRGVFSGVVENMHLHWKHRELVKLICKEKNPDRVQATALSLAAESGGILVGVWPLKRGFSALLYYRGKNYVRPTIIRPRTLLTKRQALKRAVEEQRREALEQHIGQVHVNVLALRKELAALEGPAGTESGELTSKVDELLQRVLSGPQPSVLEEIAARRDEKRTRHSLAKQERAVRLQAAVAGPTFIAGPLTMEERLRLREEGLKMGRRATFQMGRSNVVSGLARAIRMSFLQQPLVKVGVKGRAPGTPVEHIVAQLVEQTGGVFVSREPNKIILYRGYPAGESPPLHQMPGTTQSEQPGSMVSEAVLEGKEMQFEEGSGAESEGEGWEDEFDDNKDPDERVVDAEIEDLLDLDSEGEENEEYDTEWESDWEISEGEDSEGEDDYNGEDMEEEEGEPSDDQDSQIVVDK